MTGYDLYLKYLYPHGQLSVFEPRALCTGETYTKQSMQWVRPVGYGAYPQQVRILLTAI